MQDVSQTRLPPIDIHVKKLAREPQEKSWPKFKRVLIDYPRDRNLLHRQKLWDFQKLNRGAFRSHVTSLPEIPYRVNTNKPETATVGVQSDMRMIHQAGLKLILPQIRETIQKALNKVDAAFNSERSGKNAVYSGIVSYDASDTEDPGFEFDSVKRRKNAGTMTDPTTKVVFNERKKSVRRKKILKDKSVTPTERPSSRKIVKFADDEEEKDDDSDLEWLDNLDIEEQERMYLEEELETEEIVDELEEQQEEEGLVEEQETKNREPPPIDRVVIASRISSASSSSSSDSSNMSFDAGNIGPSSQRSLDPLSVLDFLSGSRVADARVMNKENKRNRNSPNDSVRTPRKSKLKEIPTSEENRHWYQKIVGDKDIVDLTNYENFARTRPTNDSLSDSNNEKYLDLNKISSSRRGINYTPRLNGEVGKSQSRAGQYNPGYSKDATPTKRHGETPSKYQSNSRRTVFNAGKFY